MRRYLFFLLVCLLWWASGASQPSPTAAQDPASEVIRLVNEFRVGMGLPPFRVNATLSVAAQQQASYMAANNLYSHTGAGGTTPQQRANGVGYQGLVVENIVGGTTMTARQGLIWWQNSPVHYATIASDRYVEIGAGYAYGSGQHFYAIVVGRPSDTPASQRPTSNSDQPAPVRIIPMTLSEPGEDGAIMHRLQAGQSLWMVAAHYNVPLAELLELNELQENSMVQVGAEIMVRPPEGYVRPPTPTPSPIYVVQRGDTAWKIAALNGLTVEQLLWYNGLAENHVLTPGQALLVRIPEGAAPPPTPTPQTTHVVRAGDSLWGIAGRYGLVLDDLLVWNGLTAEAVLSIGQVLLIRPPLPPADTPTPTPSPTLVATPTAVAVAQGGETAVGLSSWPAVSPTPTAEVVLMPQVSLASEQVEALPDVQEGQTAAPWWGLAAVLVLLLGLLRVMRAL